MKKNILQSVATVLAVANLDTIAGAQSFGFENAGEPEGIAKQLGEQLLLDDKELLSFEADTAMFAKAAVMAATPKKFFKTAVEQDGLALSTSSFGIEDERRKVSLEAFSGDNPSMVQAATYAYNLSASKQDSIWEALYPTIIGDPVKAGMQIIIDVPYTQEEFLRSASGRNDAKQNKVSIVESMNDAEGVFGKNKLKMIPVYSVVTDPQLLADWKVANVKYDAAGEVVTTAPYKAGTTVNTLDVCQSDAMISKGTMTQDDGLSRRISVESIALTLGADKILLETPFAPKWAYTLDGSSRDVQTAYAQMIDVDFSTIKQFDGTATTEFASAPAGYSARFELRVSGQGNLITSDLAVDINEFRYVGVVDAAGNLSTSGAAYDAYLAIAETNGVSNFNGVGYYLDITVHNKNLRNPGIFITSDPQGKYIPFEAFTPVSAVAPVAGQDIGETDAKFLNELTAYPRIFAAMNAAMTTIDFVNYMSSVPAGGKASINAAGECVVDATMTGGTLDLTQELDSTRSGERASDVKAVFETKLALAFTEALSLSKYFTFNEVHAGGGKIDVAIATDLETASLIGSTLDFGPQFNVKVYGTSNTLFAGKLMAVPTRFNIADRSKPEVRAFGNYLYAPTPVTEVVKTISGSTVRVFEVNPIGTHEIIMPVMAMFEVSGLTSALGKITQNRRTVV